MQLLMLVCHGNFCGLLIGVADYDGWVFGNKDFSEISSGFGQFVRLKYLNLSYSQFLGQVLLELSNLSNLVS
jgi:hypothetical protein